MDFTHDGDSMGYRGGDNALTGIMAGSMLNRDEGKTSTMLVVLAVVFFVIVFIIALVFLAMAFKDKGYDRRDGSGTDIAAMLTPLIAAKSMESNGYKTSEFDKLEIMQKLEASEDRARQTQTQQEIGALGKEFSAMGFGLASKIDNVEKEQLKTYAVIQNQLGMQNMALQQLLTKSNNSDIINGVIQTLSAGMPCYAK